jgi:hypothetical protein
MIPASRTSHAPKAAKVFETRMPQRIAGFILWIRH